MSYLEYNIKFVPTGPRKFLYLNWPLALLLAAVASVGFLMLYSVAGGDISRWAEPQMKRFGVGFILMIFVAMVPIYFWRNISAVAYGVSLMLLVAVELFGDVGMGAQRWINLGFMRLQPSELMKITLVMLLAAYYDWLPLKKISHPLWVAIPVALILVPTALVLRQPDLGTAILLLTGGGALMFMAGVHWAYFLAVISSGVGLLVAVFESRGTTWQLLNNYQYKRIDTFLDPAADPLNAGYHITQSKIALGSGGWTGRGFMQGTQSRLNFLPEKHTDFIFTTLSEEFGFVGAITLLTLYALIIMFCISSALSNSNRYGQLLTLGIAMAFFLFFSVNMAMVMGLIPVVGVPLPLISYGGSAMLVLMIAFGLVQSAHVHKPR
ncbi:rod shape-determining protein RodA [Lentibacter algarum]|uniref:rod shape-determining protein RodA n=1 Tax=Lentibacter algarum TaxID=576131 RepID=UPI001C07B73D|nr:rod shape-determining protein RodA [Lentibacter algarum]